MSVSGALVERPDSYRDCPFLSLSDSDGETTLGMPSILALALIDVELVAVPLKRAFELYSRGREPIDSAVEETSDVEPAALNVVVESEFLDALHDRCG